MLAILACTFVEYFYRVRAVTQTRDIERQFCCLGVMNHPFITNA